MTSLAPAGEHVDALRALLERVEAENVMEIDAVKESSYVASDGRRRGPGAGPGLSRWAILGGDGCVIGYMSGRFGGGIPGPDLPEGTIGGFISMIVMVKEARSRGHAMHAVREFAKLARSGQGTTEIGLRLDEAGDWHDVVLDSNAWGSCSTAYSGPGRSK